MSDFIEDSFAYTVYEKGQLIGKQKSCAESKWTWYELYQFNGKVYALAFSTAGLSFGHEIAENEIEQYIGKQAE